IDCIWLLPIYASPLRDGGYDIADFTAILPDFGTIGDFVELVEAAHKRGVRGLLRLVRHRRPVQRSAGHLRRHRAVKLDLRPGPRPVLLAPVLLPPARPELREPAGSGRHDRGTAILAGSGYRRVPAGRRAVSVRARGHQLREPQGDARVPDAGQDRD